MLNVLSFYWNHTPYTPLFVFFPCFYVFVHALHIIGDSLGASRPLLDWYAVVLTVTPRPDLLQNARVSVFCVCACFRSQWCFRVVNESGQVLLLLSLIAIGREIGQEVQVSTAFCERIG